MTRDDRAAILARRRFFVASALAGLAGTQCDNAARPCLEVAPPPDAAAVRPATPTTPDAATRAAPTPQPCLEVAPPREDAAAAALPHKPVPTASQRPKPGPQPCLKVVIPRELTGLEKK